MEMVVMDLTGPFDPLTWDGFCYALVVVEASCRYPMKRLLKGKDEVGSTVCDLIAILEWQSGLKVKKMCSDNGREFVNKQMNKSCQINSILHETTVPFKPQQNGIAERAIAILFEMVRSMIHASKIDKCYWGEAFMYAVHIRSITPTSALNGKVPFEAWTRHKPDISHLRIFGSLGWATVPKAVREGKLESRDIQVRMLGWWTDETKGYHLKDLESGKLITSIDVDFSEDDMPSELATFDLGLTQSNEEEVNEMIDSAMEYDDEHYRLPMTPPQTSSVPPIKTLPTTPIRESTLQVPSSTSSEIDFVTAREGESVSDIGPIINVPPAPRKSKKWSDLPKCEVSTRQRKQTKTVVS
jgi:hypothetical protein